MNPVKGAGLVLILLALLPVAAGAVPPVRTAIPVIPARLAGDRSVTTATGASLLTELADLHRAIAGSDYAFGQLEHLVDSIGSRPCGSAAVEAAARHIAGELRRPDSGLGLFNVTGKWCIE
jgi:hypothetical protein